MPARHGGTDQVVPQPIELMAHLTCPKKLVEFTDEQGAGGHCHSGAQRLLAARIFDWLDKTPSAEAGGNAVDGVRAARLP